MRERYQLLNEDVDVDVHEPFLKKVTQSYLESDRGLKIFTYQGKKVQCKIKIN